MPFVSFMLSAFVLVATVLGSPGARVEETGLVVSAMSFNIRYGTAGDGKHAWPHRNEGVVEFIRTSGEDFIGLQEVLLFQMAEIHHGAGDVYGLISRTRERNDGFGEANTLLYKKDRWTLDPEHHGTFWLSKTPGEPGSKSWESSLPRIATWGRFIERGSNRAVWVLNTHFDHRSANARAEGAKLIAERIGDQVPPGEPLIVLGDLNAQEGSAPLKALMAGGGEHSVRLVDTFRVLHPDETAKCTFNGWGTGREGRKIDYVLVPSGTKVLEAAIIRKQLESGPISDHWPVRARVEFAVPDA